MEYPTLRRLLTFVSLVVLSTTAAYPQHHDPAEPHVIAQVDGAANPDAIPDVVAYRHFFGVLIPKQNATPEENERRRRSYLEFFFQPGCGDQRNEDRSLTDTQRERLLSVADGLGTKLRSIEDEMRALKRSRSSTADPNQVRPELIALRQQRDEAIGNAMLSITSEVGADADEKVRRHVLEHVKARVRMVTVRIPIP